MTAGPNTKGYCHTRLALISTLATTALGASADNSQTITDSAGRQAAEIEWLWWVFFWVCTAVYLLVLIFLGLGVLRQFRRRQVPSGLATRQPAASKAADRPLAIAVSVAVAGTVVILFALLLAEFFTARQLHALSSAPDPLKIKVTAQQWWWHVQYEDYVSSNIVTTANELHVPVGRPVQVTLKSLDVIHSFWVPNLNGKRDAIPGYESSIWLQADQPGTFAGQCAEFCGHQHAKMRFTVTAEPPDDFAQWLNAQRASANPPQTESQKQGQEVFLRSSCVMCHSISGTPARATVGPDLSHIASRPTLAAGSLENNRGNLAGWILDPQRIKPGTRMPQNNLDPQDLQYLLDYLESLK